MKKETIICNGMKNSNTQPDNIYSHPRVSLHIPRKANKVTCPYCKREFHKNKSKKKQ